MKTLAVLSCKGGTGKTTLALHLAVAAQNDGRSVLVADLDRQRSALDWRREREAPAPRVEDAKSGAIFTMQQGARRLGSDLMIIDTASSREDEAADAARCADLCLVVVRPHFLDLKAVASTARMVRNMNRSGVFVINQAPPRWTARDTPTTAPVMNALRSFGLPVAPGSVRMRDAYHLCLGQGRTVQETEPGGAAACEIDGLWRHVEALLWPEMAAPLLKTA